jgi:glycosyltransferase involved in cell wall biosynthesis
MVRPQILEIGKSTAGIGTYLRWLAYGLDSEVFDLTFACLSEGGETLAKELASIKGVESISWPMNRFSVDPLSDLILTFKIALLIRTKKFDLIHAHGSKAGFIVRLAAIGSRVPVVYSPHCFSFHDGVNPLIAKLLAGLERFSAKFLTSRIITVADGEQTLARRFRVGSPNQFITVHSGIDPVSYDKFVDKPAIKRLLSISQEGQIVGAVGRLGKQKAPLDFVRMAALVNAKMPNMHFVWAGSGPLEEEARKLTEEFGISGVCHFIGEFKDIPSLLGIMDCFVLPSLWEGFPIVLLEAMATGVPIVATNIPGNDEAIASGESGWLVEPNTPSELAEKVLKLLNDPDQAAAFASVGKKRIREEFNRKLMLTTIQNVYLNVLDEIKNKL